MSISVLNKELKTASAFWDFRKSQNAQI